MENVNPIGKKLSDIRIKRGETQEAVAEAVGISYVSLSRYETGQREPKTKILARIADHYGVTLDELTGRETEEPKQEDVPKTREARIVSGLMDKLPLENREQIVNVVYAMCKNRPELFEGENENEA